MPSAAVPLPGIRRELFHIDLGGVARALRRSAPADLAGLALG